MWSTNRTSPTQKASVPVPGRRTAAISRRLPRQGRTSSVTGDTGCRHLSLTLHGRLAEPGRSWRVRVTGQPTTPLKERAP